MLKRALVIAENDLRLISRGEENDVGQEKLREFVLLYLVGTERELIVPIFVGRDIVLLRLIEREGLLFGVGIGKIRLVCRGKRIASQWRP